MNVASTTGWLLTLSGTATATPPRTLARELLVGLRERGLNALASV